MRAYPGAAVVAAPNRCAETLLPSVRGDAPRPMIVADAGSPQRAQSGSRGADAHYEYAGFTHCRVGLSGIPVPVGFLLALSGCFPGLPLGDEHVGGPEVAVRERRVRLLQLEPGPGGALEQVLEACAVHGVVVAHQGARLLVRGRTQTAASAVADPALAAPVPRLVPV